MKFGMSLYPYTRYPDAAAMFETVKLADELGFDTITIGEHVVMPPSHADRIETTWYDPLVLATAITTSTVRVKAFFSVLVLPYYHPVRLAKAIATLDLLSGGRVIVGVGAGWLEPEFKILGVPFAERGARLSEGIRVMKELWTSPSPTFAGRWVSFQDVGFSPRPVQQPHPPIWVGGRGKNALRRAVELGDGIYPGTGGPLDLLIGDMPMIRDMLAAKGRDPAKFTFSHAIEYGGSPGLAHPEAFSVRRPGEQAMIYGFDAGPVREHVAKAEEAGIAHIGVRFPGANHHEVMAAMRKFHDEVME